jgi:nitroimidazol reductase NimA-like FMN-containing flavoprotein (pyridoxamine 5'-phosphate oxidase superfamily)
MADMAMTTSARDTFLADVHVGILSIGREGKGPLALPIWYQYVDGEIIIGMSGESAKAKLLRAAARATMTVQTEQPPYKYVMVEGPVEVVHEQRDDVSMASRYLGETLGAQYAQRNPSTSASVVVHLTPESWITCDFSKG